MIAIIKRQEPGKLLAYRKSLPPWDGRHPDNRYEDMPPDTRLAIKRRLMEEQGCLCAYCMAKLPAPNEIKIGDDRVTIEHWLPQSPADGSPGHDPLDYRNMLGVCKGNRGCGDKHNLTCDAARENKPLKVNPLQSNTLVGISYSSGEISSPNASVNRDLTEILNLNCKAVSLPERRLNALKELKTGIDKKYPGKRVPRAALQKLLKKYQSSTARKKPYVGILIWWLEKRLARP